MTKELAIVRKNIREGKELYYSYQSNIAMAFVDECYNYKKKRNISYLTKSDIHQIANKAAKNFLNLWIKE